MTTDLEVAHKDPVECPAPTDALDTSELTEKSKKHIVYARFKLKPPTREAIRLLNPGIIDVRFPRQKSAKFVLLEFENEAAAALGFKQMKKASGKEIKFLQGHKQRERKSAKKPVPTASEPVADDPLPQPAADDSTIPSESAGKSDNPVPKKCLCIDGLPLFATQEVLQSLYPKQTKVVVGKQDTLGKLQAVVHFASAAEATEALKASNGVNVNGEKLSIMLYQGKGKGKNKTK